VTTETTPSPENDTFGAMIALCRMIGNPQIYGERAAELQRLSSGCAEAQAALAAARQEHDQAVAALAQERAEVAADRKRAAELWASLELREADLREREAAVAEERALQVARSGRYVPLPGGGCQDFGPDGPEIMPAAPLVRTPPEPPSSDMAAERVPHTPAGVTLTRSAPRESASIATRRAARREVSMR
jgi:hypothetical protein